MKEEPKHGLEVNKTRTRVLKGKRWGGAAWEWASAREMNARVSV